MIGLMLAALGEGAGAPACSGLPAGGAHFVIVGRNTPPPASGLAPLRYADDDARRMRAVALDQLCFRPDQITLLVEGDATAERVGAVLAAHAGSAPGRFFVYVSAHGSEGEGIQLDRALPWQALHEHIAAVGARQTFVFLDTCDSTTFVESRLGGAKGRVRITPRLDEGRFYLTASTGRAFERHWLRGGVATNDFFSVVYGYGSPDDARVISSNDVCRILTRRPELVGECDQQIKGGEGIILVPDRRPPGWLQIEEGASPGVWSYVLEDGDGGASFPIRVIDVGDSTPRRSDGLPPGRYRLRRARSDRRQCAVADVTIAAGRTTTVAPPDWRPEPRRCRWLEERESRVPGRPAQAIGVGLRIASPWIEATRADVGLEATYQRHDLAGYRVSLGAWLGWLPEDGSVQPSQHRLTALDFGLGAAWDALHTRLGALDVFLGAEAGAGWGAVSRAADVETKRGLSGAFALRPGMALRVFDGQLVEVRGALGVRTYRWGGAMIAAPRLGLVLGGSVGWD